LRKQTQYLLFILIVKIIIIIFLLAKELSRVNHSAFIVNKKEIQKMKGELGIEMQPNKSVQRWFESYISQTIVTCISLPICMSKCEVYVPEKSRRKSNFNFNGRRKGKKAYIGWEDNDNWPTLSDLDKNEIADLCLMGHKHHEAIHFDSESESNPFYEELEQALVDMHDDAMKAFEKLIAKKKIILKLEVERSQHKKYFECLKDEHASLVNKKIVIPCIEPPKANSPKYDWNWMNFVSF